MRPQQLLPNDLLNELLRLYQLSPNWCLIKPQQDTVQYQCTSAYKTWLSANVNTGADWLGFKAASCWLGEGPKEFIPTIEQCKAMEKVDINIPFSDYSQPYPAILVVLPKGYEPFHSVLCYKDNDVLVASLHSPDHMNDIVTTIYRFSSETSGNFIETFINKYDDDCKDTAAIAALVLRVAFNCCLALSNYGCHAKYLHPGELTRDKTFAKEKEDSERKQRAIRRIALAVQVVSFDREVTFYHTEGNKNNESLPTGSSMPCHWRRGHWAMQAYGAGLTLRKRILRPPVMVRADLFLGKKSDTKTTYKAPS